MSERRSRLQSVIGWALLVLAFPAILVGLLDVGCGLRAQQCQFLGGAGLGLPPLSQLVFPHRGDLTLVSLVYGLTEIVAGFGTLQQRESGRRLVLALLAWSIATTGAGTVVASASSESVGTHLLGAGVFVLACALMFYRLCRADARAQFQSRSAGLSLHSRVAVGLFLAHSLIVRLALGTVSSKVAVELIALLWPLWLVGSWPLVDSGHRRWVPLLLACGLACLGWEGIQFVIIDTVWLLEHGSLGN